VFRRLRRFISSSTLSLLLVLISASWSHAGLYGGNKAIPGPTIENGVVKPLSFGQFRQYFTLYTVDMINPASPTYKGFLAESERLQKLARTGTLTTPDALDLSVGLIRMRKFEDAVKLLTPIALRERSNFMILGNLASAMEAMESYDRALGYLQQVQDFWPHDWPGWSKAQLDWHQELEKAQLRLVKKRYRERLQKPGKHWETVDDLFEDASGPVKYRAEDGAYQPGKLAEAERKKLPPNALAIVQQLVLWFPDDTRLYWQLGELYNAQGDIAAASTILEECVWTRRSTASTLQEHRKLTQAAVPKQTGPVLEEDPTATKPTPPPNEPAAWMPERRQFILVGGLAGLIIVVLLFLQIREIRQRRRQHRP
jgi:tetratricopeptide (TPR) repeat protein